jgi:hypothetical protein
MTWSLGVEEQFYAVIPILMVLLARIRRRLLLPAILAVCILSFLLAWRQVVMQPANAFYLLPGRAWELGIGVALAVAEQTRKPLSLPAPLAHLLGIMGILLMLAPIFLLKATSLFPGPAALPSVLGTALLIALPGSCINRRLLSLPPLVFIGRISYSWYLWHWPLLAYLRIASYDTAPAGAVLAAVAASLAIAVLSYSFIEQPFRRSHRSPGPLLIRYALASSFLLALCSGIWLSPRFSQLPQRFPELAKVDSETRSRQESICMFEDYKLELSPPCYDASDPRPAVAIWGDSHSASLAPGLRAIAQAQGYGFVQIGHGFCSPFTGAAFYNTQSPQSAQQCIQFNNQVLNLLRDDPRVRIVVLASMWRVYLPNGWAFAGSAHDHEILAPDAASALFRRSLAATIESLQAAGKQVIVMEDVPSFEFDPLMKFRTAHIPARHQLSAWMGAEVATDTGTGPASRLDEVAIANTQLRIVADGFKNVPLIDLKSEFCGENNECIYRIGDRLLFRDPNHLSFYGAHYALRDFHLPAQ